MEGPSSPLACNDAECVKLTDRCPGESVQRSYVVPGTWGPRRQVRPPTEAEKRVIGIRDGEEKVDAAGGR